MPSSLHSPEVIQALASATVSATVTISAPDFEQPRQITKPFPSPVDWRDHWIYFLMIDRFNNPESFPVSDWDREAGDRQGGTFEGVRQQLPYLQDLGAGALWLTPVLKNRPAPPQGSHHGYGIMDFLEVDPRFGTTPEQAEAELIRLIDETHARGMHVILDVVINHAGDVFGYDVDGEVWDGAPWKSPPYQIYWRDENGQPRRDWSELPEDLPRDAGIWPQELQRNEWMRRQGKGGPLQGDFETLKEFKTEYTDRYHDKPVWNLLIEAYQYVIAKYDFDGFRIDTLRHVEHEFARTFCNAIREFALSIGKKNFFLFGESKSSDEGLLARYVGRFTSEEEGRLGADAALDFPLQWSLGPVAKASEPPTAVEDVFNVRKQVHRDLRLLSTHGEASRFFVTFLDNHDDHHRFLHPRDGQDYTDQLTMAVTCLFCLQGIPCLYYGTEQGLKGVQELYQPHPPNGKPEHVREALWGKPSAFDQSHPIYQQIRAIARLRDTEPALRYGRQYFRPVSGNNHDFGPSVERGGVLAVSRILNNREVLVVANTSVSHSFSGWVMIDSRLNRDDVLFEVAYSNKGTTGEGHPVSGPVTFHHRSGGATSGWARRVFIRLAPMEAQILVAMGS